MLAILLAAATGVCFTHAPVMESDLSASAMRASYPPAARIRGVDGEAKVACRIDAQGMAAGCKVLSQAPSDVGFGDAAVRVLRRQRFYPAISCGKPATADYTVTSRFRAEGQAGTVE